MVILLLLIYKVSVSISRERENIKINGADAVYFRTNDELNGVIFNNGKYIFIVNGNISKDDIVNIAQNAE